MLGNKTPITYVTPGYKPDLDRLPPQGAGCNWGCVWLLIVMLLLVSGGIFGFIAMASPDKQETPVLPTILLTNTPSPVPTATMDYCWFLTPTAEVLPTIEVTPDVAQLKATDDAFSALLTATATPTPQPTQEPPRVWCNQPPTIEPTATWTPFQFPTDIPHINLDDLATVMLTDVPTATATPIPMSTDVPTSTLFPTVVPRSESQPQQVRIVETVIVIKEVVKEVEKPVKVEVIITATHTPTATSTLEVEVTEEPTIEPTATFTETSTATNIPTSTDIPTEVPAETSTHTPTVTATATATHTATFTPIPTSTLFPTLEVDNDA